MEGIAETCKERKYSSQSYLTDNKLKTVTRNKKHAKNSCNIFAHSFTDTAIGNIGNSMASLIYWGFSVR